jgi:hypothetical protein
LRKEKFKRAIDREKEESEGEKAWGEIDGRRINNARLYDLHNLTGDLLIRYPVGALSFLYFK